MTHSIYALRLRCPFTSGTSSVCLPPPPPFRNPCCNMKSPGYNTPLSGAPSTRYPTIRHISPVPRKRRFQAPFPARHATLQIRATMRSTFSAGAQRPPALFRWL